MKKILSAAEMRKIDCLTSSDHDVPSLTLMENAAGAVFDVLRETLGGSVASRPFLIFCGKGNNGGDGAALARLLFEAGAFVYAVLLGKIDDTKGDALHNFNFLRVYNDDLKEADEKRKLIFYTCEDPAELREAILRRYETLEKCDVIVDAILGTGVMRPLEGLYLEAVRLTNYLHEQGQCKYLVSVDLPSGLNADTADLIGEVVSADITVTFTAPKAANVLPPASRQNGKLIVADIGSPAELIDQADSRLYLADESDARKWLEDTRLMPGSYKKTRGHVLLGVGSRNYSGAAVLSANGAVKSGAGLVTAAVPRSVQAAFSERVAPEAMSLPLAETENGAFSAGAAAEFLEFSAKADVAAIGCGLSATDDTRDFVRKVAENRRTPLILDADALNLLSPFTLQGSDELPLVLTPHQGEMLRLLGTEDKSALEDRVAVAREFAAKHHVILVLKGERTLIAEPGGKVVINPTGNEGLGKGGNGDTLTGIIAGFLAQTYGGNKRVEITFEAVVAAVYIAGLAGDIAAREYGMRTMTASDVANSLGSAIEELEHNC
jgi:ADP-dependent NAD(P)H-hydrate dehydratase / NAD(P)H-hydrate epimerase